MVAAPDIIMRFLPIDSPKKNTNRLPTAQPISWIQCHLIYFHSSYSTYINSDLIKKVA